MVRAPPDNRFLLALEVRLSPGCFLAKFDVVVCSLTNQKLVETHFLTYTFILLNNWCTVVLWAPVVMGKNLSALTRSR